MLGPCRTAGDLIVAAACEVPVGCPNRVEHGALTHQVAEYLASGQNGLTPSAAAALASSTRGSHVGSLCELLLSGELTLLETRVSHAIRGGAIDRGPAVEEPPPVAATDVLTTWVKFKVVEDATGRPIPGVKLRIRLPNGNERDYTTRSDGMVEIDEIDPGTCDMDCPLEPLDKRRLTHTLDFVAMGEAPAGATTDKSVPAEASQSLIPTGDLRIAEIDEHKVQTGETLESLAAAHGMSWQELTLFNWGTSTPTEINEHLYHDVGCRKPKGDDDPCDPYANYHFSGDDGNFGSGMIRVPRRFEQTGLATERTHVVRVKSPLGLLVRVTLKPRFSELCERDHDDPLDPARGGYQPFQYREFKCEVLVDQRRVQSIIQQRHDELTIMFPCPIGEHDVVIYHVVEDNGKKFGYLNFANRVIVGRA